MCVVSVARRPTHGALKGALGMQMTEFFDTEWSQVSKRIGGTLARRGVAASDREDILQETALRLFRSWDKLDETRPVEPYARVIANNVWRDALRRGPKEDPVEQLPEIVSAPDSVEHVCEVRDEFSRVRRALGAMRLDQSRLLYAVAAEEAGDVPAAPATDAVRMARMRARRQLRVALEVASGLVAAFWAGVCRIGRGGLNNPVPVTMVSAAAGAILVLLAPVPDGGATQPESPAPTQTIVVAGGTAAELAQPAPAAAVVTGRQVGRVARPAGASARKAAAGEPPYWTPVGPAAVGAYTRVDVDGRGVMVKDNGSGLPACTFGIDTAPSPMSTDCTP